MKALRLPELLAGLSLSAVVALAQQPGEEVPQGNPPDAAPAPAIEEPAQAEPAPQPEPAPEQKSDVAVTNSPAAPRTEAVSIKSDGNSHGLADAKDLRLNFRGAPLELVLDYLSEAAGFIIVLETKVEGKVDVWSQQPVSKDEAVQLLNSILNKNGYAAIRNERTLTIVSRDEAKKRDIPVKTGNNPKEIPKNDEMVTQIIPIRNANAVQMTKDLQPLLPSFASLTANESGNALVLTDVQTDIRRMVQIVQALDTSISSISTIRVFPLKFADAKELATEVKELFPSTSTGTSRNNDPRAMFMARFGGGPGGQNGGSQSTGQSEARQAASRVTAVADERTNALVVSAPEEVMSVIELLVKEIDTNAENITELRVFPLTHANPTEMAEILAEVFPDTTKSSDTGRSQFQFGGPPGFGRMGGNGSSQSSTSTRARQKTQVVAVADERTSSIIVTAASDLMPQIEQMIKQLDANPARKQKVFVYSLENADSDTVQDVLQEMFQTTTSRSTRTTTNPLTERQQNQGYGSSGSSSSFGSSSSSSRTSR